MLPRISAVHRMSPHGDIGVTLTANCGLAAIVDAACHWVNYGADVELVRYRDADITMSDRRVPDRDHALAPALLHRLALLVRLADADIPLCAPRADQRAVGGVPRRNDIGTPVFHMLYVLSSRRCT